jgi:hypothetical protein
MRDGQADQRSGERLERKIQRPDHSCPVCRAWPDCHGSADVRAPGRNLPGHPHIRHPAAHAEITARIAKVARSQDHGMAEQAGMV